MCVVFLSVLVLDFVVFLSRVLYLELMSLRNFSSIVCCMCGHQMPQVLARVRCRWYSYRLICCFLVYRYLIKSNLHLPQVEIYTRTDQPQHTPYNQLTTGILGIDQPPSLHNITVMQQIPTRTGTTPQTQKPKIKKLILNVLQQINKYNNKHLDQCSHRNYNIQWIQSQI